MSKRIEFDQTDQAAFLALRTRQEGRCALTGRPLNETAIFHHVVPAGHGGVRNAETNAFIADLDRNCVLVNDEHELDSGRDTGPHLQAHGGSFRDGPVMRHESFKYSHGRDSAAHKSWASDGEAFVENHIFPVREPAEDSRVDNSIRSDREASLSQEACMLQPTNSPNSRQRQSDVHGTSRSSSDDNSNEREIDLSKENFNVNWDREAEQANLARTGAEPKFDCGRTSPDSGGREDSNTAEIDLSTADLNVNWDREAEQANLTRDESPIRTSETARQDERTL